MKLSIIIVNYNVTDLLRKCLSSVYKFAENVDFEVIVIDNKSPDISWKKLIEEFPQVQFLASEKNGGFAAANNIAARSARGEYILLLNPDTAFKENFLEKVLDFADTRENFGCLGVRLFDASGRFLPESKRSVPNMRNSFGKLFVNRKNHRENSYYRGDIGECEIAPVEVLTGAFLLTKKELFLRAGGLDETYFMYGEDIDFCYTLLRKGKKNWYYGEASVLHHKGESTVKDAVYLKRFFGAMHIFLQKYYKNESTLQYYVLLSGLKLRYNLAKLNLKKRDTK